jgi:hypothetical protein
MQGKDEYTDGNHHEACKNVPQSIRAHPATWMRFQMMKEGKPAYSNFDIAAYLAGVILLGCVVSASASVKWNGTART